MPMDTKGKRSKVWLYINEMGDFQSGLAGREKRKQNKTQNEEKGTSLPQCLATHKESQTKRMEAVHKAPPKLLRYNHHLFLFNSFPKHLV